MLHYTSLHYISDEILYFNCKLYLSVVTASYSADMCWIKKHLNTLKQSTEHVNYKKKAENLKKGQRQ